MRKSLETTPISAFSLPGSRGYRSRASAGNAQQRTGWILWSVLVATRNRAHFGFLSHHGQFQQAIVQPKLHDECNIGDSLSPTTFWARHALPLNS